MAFLLIAISAAGVVAGEAGPDQAQVERRLEKKCEALQRTELAAAVKEDLKTVALGTSKINYLDPRITVGSARPYFGWGGGRAQCAAPVWRPSRLPRGTACRWPGANGTRCLLRRWETGYCVSFWGGVGRGAGDRMGLPASQRLVAGSR